MSRMTRTWALPCSLATLIIVLSMALARAEADISLDASSGRALLQTAATGGYAVGTGAGGDTAAVQTNVDSNSRATTQGNANNGRSNGNVVVIAHGSGPDATSYAGGTGDVKQDKTIDNKQNSISIFHATAPKDNGPGYGDAAVSGYGGATGDKSATVDAKARGSGGVGPTAGTTRADAKATATGPDSATTAAVGAAGGGSTARKMLRAAL